MHRENDKIERYKTYLRLEKALSANSADAYLPAGSRQTDKLRPKAKARSMRMSHMTTCNSLLPAYIDIGIHPRSQARIISGIKSFYRFLFLDDYITTDPTGIVRIAQDRTGNFLKSSLSTRINSILGTIDLTLPEAATEPGRCSEVLYSCGLRVSELVSLRFTDVYFDGRRFIKVEGREQANAGPASRRQRSRRSRTTSCDRNHVAVKRDLKTSLFLSSAGTSSVARIMVFRIIKQQTEMAEYQRTVSPAHVPPFLRRPPVGRGSQLACYPGDAGT
ncbi:MAG: site-specific integrase [Parabacteroides merdae]